MTVQGADQQHAAHRRGNRRRAAPWLVLTCVVVCAGTWWCAPALAASARGHVFSASLGSEGEGALSDPGQIAVDDATGDVYVLDRGHDRIVRYGPQGEFLAAWGWGVQNGAAEYQVCTAGCQPGAPGRGKYQFNAYVMSIAVDDCTKQDGEPCSSTEDPSVGDVYVLAESATGSEQKELTELEEATGRHVYSERAVIEELSPTGEPLERVSTVKYSEAGLEQELELECEEGEDARALTVAPDGTVWLYYEGELFEGEGELFALSDKNPRKTGAPLRFQLGSEREPVRGLAVDAGGDFFTGYVGPLRLLILSRAPAQVQRMALAKWHASSTEGGLQEVSLELPGEETTGLAVQQRAAPGGEATEEGALYAAGGGGVVELSAHGQPAGRFGTQQLKSSAGVAVDSATGSVYVADPVAGNVDVFALEGEGAPRVDGTSVTEVSAESAKLQAQVAPADQATTYSFRYLPGSGPVPGSGEPCEAPCVQLPSAEGELAAGWGDSIVSVQAPGLTPGLTYRYRAIARNAAGIGEREGSFSTPPAAPKTPAGDGLADGRAWELVSPPQKGGAQVEGLNEEDPHGGLIQAAPDGDAIAYLTNEPVGEAQGNRAYEGTQMLATRGPSGWSSQDIATPNEHGTSLGAHTASEYQFFSEDLALSLVEPFRPNEEVAQEIGPLAEPPLSPPLTVREQESGPGKGQERTPYLRADAPVAPQGQAQSALYEQARSNGQKMEAIALAAGRTVENAGYVPLLDDQDALPGARFGGSGVEVIDANADLSTVVMSLQAGIAGSQEGLYEWHEGSLTPLTVPPCEEAGGSCSGEPLPGARLGDDSKDLRGAISTDGSRVFWSGTREQYEGHLYMRATVTPPGDPARAETIQLDTAHGVSQPSGAGGAVFQSANIEGTRVFFTDTQPLTPNAGGGERNDARTPDLYVCEIVENPEHRLECSLSDLTPAHDGEESADVQGTVLGSSEDGSYVYFVADGIQGDDPDTQGEVARPGSCVHVNRNEETVAQRHATCNLYLERYSSQTQRWEEPLFVAALSHEDLPDWESSYDAGTVAELDNVTARVSPNGRYLAFMSDRPLTAFYGQSYDNDATAQEAGDAPVEEVYEYAAPEPGQDGPGSLVCASCAPSGAPPRGLLEPESGPGQESLLADRTENWPERWLGGILPGWTRVQLAGLPFTLHQSRYLSNSGRLYFDSPEPLVPGAANNLSDVYEYEPAGVPAGSRRCTGESEAYDERAAGCLALISSGTSDQESAFLDASETGSDVFFISAGRLTPQQQEAGYSLYDAHECTAASPCIPQAVPPTKTECETTETCRTYDPSSTALGQPASASSGAAGNDTPGQGVLSNKTKEAPKPKPLTRSQKLAKALKACRAAHKHSRAKRLRCERAARKRYAPPTPTEKSKAKR